jgi:hypothetical protein
MAMEENFYQSVLLRVLCNPELWYQIKEPLVLGSEAQEKAKSQFSPSPSGLQSNLLLYHLVLPD